MPKYYYKPLIEKIKEAYLVNANVDYTPGFDVESNVRIVIEAETEELAEKSRWGFVDINMWELDKVEDEGQ